MKIIIEVKGVKFGLSFHAGLEFPDQPRVHEYILKVLENGAIGTLGNKKDLKASVLSSITYLCKYPDNGLELQFQSDMVALLKFFCDVDTITIEE